jgi:hypothetical protein
MKMKANLSEIMVHNKGSAGGRFLAMNAYIKNTEISQKKT